MKKRLVMLALLLAAAGVQAAPSTQVQGQLAPLNVQGVWQVNYCWEGADCAADVLLVDEFAVFLGFTTLADNPAQYVDEGVGFVSGSYAVFHYHQGCRPDYISSQTTDTGMGGSMHCTDGSGTTGTWSANLLSHAAAAAAQFKPQRLPGTLSLSGMPQR